MRSTFISKQKTIEMSAIALHRDQYQTARPVIDHRADLSVPLINPYGGTSKPD
jgi:hypothetical protein